MVYDSRENWPPYTYRDYPDIKQDTFDSFMDFLSIENKSDKVLELQPWISLCASRCTFCYYPTSAFNPSIISFCLFLISAFNGDKAFSCSETS